MSTIIDNIISQAKLQEQLRFDIDAARAITRQVKYKNNFKTQGDIFALVGCKKQLADSLSTSQYAGKHINKTVGLTGVVRADVVASKLMSISKKIKNDISTTINLSKLMPYQINAFDSLLLSSSATTTETTVIILSGQLQAGDIIEIDSEFFTVTKNGINIFDQYNNEWVFLSRDLVDLAFSAAGEMDIGIIYKERYL